MVVSENAYSDLVVLLPLLQELARVEVDLLLLLLDHLSHLVATPQHVRGVHAQLPVALGRILERVHGVLLLLGQRMSSIRRVIVRNPEERVGQRPPLVRSLPLQREDPRLLRLR